MKYNTKQLSDKRSTNAGQNPGKQQPINCSFHVLNQINWNNLNLNFVTGLNLVIQQQPSIAVQAKTKADIAKKSS